MFFSFFWVAVVGLASNGGALATAFRGVRGVLYPAVSVRLSPGFQLRMNFGGAPFLYDPARSREEVDVDEKADE